MRFFGSVRRGRRRWRNCNATDVEPGRRRVTVTNADSLGIAVAVTHALADTVAIPDALADSVTISVADSDTAGEHWSGC